MPIDINQPLGPNRDVVINYEDGRQELGSPEERQAAVDKGQVIGEHTNGVPVDSGEAEEAPVAPARASNGKFAKKETPVAEPVPEAPAEAPEQPAEQPASEPAAE